LQALLVDAMALTLSMPAAAAAVGAATRSPAVPRQASTARRAA
jgi:hypothetical protein